MVSGVDHVSDLIGVQRLKEDLEVPLHNATGTIIGLSQAQSITILAYLPTFHVDRV